MKILLANKFYYRRGGDCIYMLNLEQLLKKHGHEVAVFAMQHPENLPTEWNKYFPSEVNFKPGVGAIEAFMRPLGTQEVKNKFDALLRTFKPDIVHLNNVHSQLSPIIAELAHKKNIKVVWTLHDYKLLCPRYDCLRNGKSCCEACFTDKFNVLRYACMKNSRMGSLLSYIEAAKWTRERLEICTDLFICPSRFMADKMVQGGFDRNKMHVLCNFIDSSKCQGEYDNKGDYYCYMGRLSHEKGVETLLEVANGLPYKLIIIGEGPLEQKMKSLANKNVEFTGFKQWEEIKELVGNARFSVMPSEWYENNPLSIIESLCLGTPVLGAQIGGIPELIEEGVTGMCFESRNTEDLKKKIEAMFSAAFNHAAIAQRSQEKYNAERNYKQLITIYKEIN